MIKFYLRKGNTVNKLRIKELILGQMDGLNPILFFVMILIGYIFLQLLWLLGNKYKEIYIPLNYKLVRIFFLVYLCFIFQITLCNRETGSRDSISIIPFQNIFHWTGELNESRLLYALLNCLMFVPYGFFISFFKSCYRWEQMFLLITSKSFLLSGLIEITQLITSRGFFETEDLICNTVGGIFGYILFLMLVNVFPKIRLKQM